MNLTKKEQELITTALLYASCFNVISNFSDETYKQMYKLAKKLKKANPSINPKELVFSGEMQGVLTDEISKDAFTTFKLKTL